MSPFVIPSEPTEPPPPPLVLTDEMRTAALDEMWARASTSSRQAFAKSLRANGYLLHVDRYTTT